MKIAFQETSFWLEELVAKYLFYFIQFLESKYKILDDHPFVLAYYYLFIILW